MQIDSIFFIIILIFSAIIHEVAHGYSAFLLGDNTARYQGRLSLNPLRHLEWFGSFLVPVISYYLGGFIIGWAKPVPYNPYNLRNQKWGEAIVAGSGPAVNIIIAVFFGLLLRFGILSMFGTAFVQISLIIIYTNLVLATFNLVPIPPLDGSKILFSILPYRWREVRNFYERNGFVLMMVFVFLLWRFIAPLVGLEFELLTGLLA